jgi:PAS domain S-box-containing protein
MSPSPRTTTYPELAERVLHSIPCGVLVIDRRGRISGVNPRTCELFGVAEKDLAGRDCADVLRTEDTHWYSLDPIDRLGDPGAGRSVEGKIGGRKVSFTVELSPYRDESGETIGTLVLIDEPFRRSHDPENQAERLISLGELSACVAHEIRNPLTGIRTTVQFVGRKLDAGDPRQEDLEAVISELDRIEKIIDDLLQFSRPQTGNRSMVNLNALLDRTLDSLGPQCESLAVQVRRNLHPRLPESCMDSDMIQQVLFNLINNALEAMAESGGTLKVTSTVRRFRSGHPNLEVFISDTGRGIDPDSMAKIFQPFFTTRAAGTGLGLPISLQIVRAHGGRISARNRARGGAIFRVSLPLTEVDEA